MRKKAVGEPTVVLMPKLKSKRALPEQNMDIEKQTK